MQRFWKNQAALNAGDPVALTRLPPELAESAQSLWEQALRLSQQTALHDDNAARAKLSELQRDTEVRANKVQIVDLQAQIEDYRQRLSTMITRASTRAHPMAKPKIPRSEQTRAPTRKPSIRAKRRRGNRS